MGDVGLSEHGRFHEYVLEVDKNSIATKVFHNILIFRTLELLYTQKKHKLHDKLILIIIT